MCAWTVESILIAFVVFLVGIVEVARVLHCDGVALFGLVNAIARRDYLLGDAHDMRSVGSMGNVW